MIGIIITAVVTTVIVTAFWYLIAYLQYKHLNKQFIQDDNSVGYLAIYKEQLPAKIMFNGEKRYSEIGEDYIIRKPHKKNE